ETGLEVTSTIFQNANHVDDDDSEGSNQIRPASNSTTKQEVAGTYISFYDLDIPVNTTIYGISIFPGDVSASNDLIGLADVPLDTDGGNDGGLDFMGGGGFVIEEHEQILVGLSGQILNDVNGLTDDEINGNGLEELETGVASSIPLYA